MALSRRRAGLLPHAGRAACAGHPAQIGEKTALIDCCEVQDIVALLDVLVSPPARPVAGAGAEVALVWLAGRGLGGAGAAYPARTATNAALVRTSSCKLV
jgi:hypothetical protein